MFHVHYTPKQCLGKLQSIIFFVLNAFYCNHPPMNNPDRKGVSNRTPKYIYPPLSVVIRLQPKGGLSACIRFDQKSGTKNPDLLSQIRILVVEVTGFEPATFWSRRVQKTFQPSDTRKNRLFRMCLNPMRWFILPSAAVFFISSPKFSPIFARIVDNSV